MARLLKQMKTFHVGPDGKRCSPDAQGAEKVVKESAKWYGQGIPGLPATKRVPLATNRRVAEQMLAELVVKGERSAGGLSVRDEGRQLLEPLVAEFDAELKRKRDGKHAKFTLLCIRRVLTGAKLVSVLDLKAKDVSGKVEAVVWGLTEGEDAVSEPTAARHGKHARQFTRWLWKRKKLFDHDPLDGLELPSQTPVRKRAHLSPSEFATLFDTTHASERLFRGLTGPERAALYLTAAATGYRTSELAALTPAHFDLDAECPVVKLAGRSTSGRRTKNGKDAVQDLGPAVVKRLRPLLAGVPAGVAVWGGSWSERSADMIRADLAEAKLPAAVEGEELVFHSLRHTFGAMVDRASPSARVTKDMMRHSTVTLSIDGYGHLNRGETAAVAARLPLPGSDHAPGPFSQLSRADLEALAEGLAGVLGGLYGALLVTPRVTLPAPRSGAECGTVERPRPEDAPRPVRLSA